ncbi:hypothetical protein HN011_009521 [Eciton burchellii]|nr:hypothetical protein HN011_009521 [Eciton burchellii]
MSSKLAKKPKNNKNKNKKDLPESHVLPKVTTTSSASGLDPEAEDRFELELCWCIQQLEVNLANDKSQKKQTQNIGKYIQSLKNNSVPLIKKRQIMNNILGDYRKKMIEDERKLNKTVSTVKKAYHNTEEYKSRADDHKEEDKLVNTKAIIDSNRTDQTPFQFNFQTC